MDIQDLAVALDMPATQIEAAVNGNDRLCPKLALRLSRYFGTSAHFWMSIDAHNSLEHARHELGDALTTIEPLDVSLFDSTSQ